MEKRATSPNESRFVKYKNREYSKDATYDIPNITSEFTDSTEIYNPNADARKKLMEEGIKYLKDKKKMAIIIFAGGYGCRSQKKTPKEFEQTGENETLFDSTMKKVLRAVSEFSSVSFVIYIICSKLNSERVIEYVENIGERELQIYVCYQHEEKLLDSNGLESVKNKDNNHITYPSGIGAFLMAEIFYNENEKFTLRDHIEKIINPDLVYCLGTCNLLEEGIDPEIIGLIEGKGLACVFKCCQVRNANSDLTRVCTKKGSKINWCVQELKNLYYETGNQTQVNKFPVWMYHFVFKPSFYENRPKIHSKETIIEFKERTLVNGKGLKLNCRVCEYTITHALMMQEMKKKCIGYYPKENNYHFLKTSDDFQNININKKSSSASVIEKKKDSF